MSGETPKSRGDAETTDLPAVPNRETIVAPVAGEMPERIGHYRLKRRIGTGGMGTVYEAEQDHPHRTVALKVMKQGVTSRSALRRFEYESEVLARLRHAGIAQVYEAGTHDDGSGGVPYFAMEYIHGARILTQYVEAEHLDTDARLELFLEICAAVHHGHQKGIIHRDLKPENILVDSAGHTKIIDFGIARATDSDLRAATLQTQVGELVGTVPYMSPEQCAADPHDIDTRSDVYALGIVCYELLTGALPYDVTDVAIYEATRIIREERPTPFDPVNSELKGDIETIVFKALEKDRERRYQSAAAMGDDINRFLRRQPILARPPSVYYQLRSFAKRNKALVAGAAAVMVALTVGFIGTSVGFVQAREAEGVAREAEAKAVQEAKTSRAVKDYFKYIFGMGNAEQTGMGKGATVLDVIAEASEDVNVRFADQPEVRAELLISMGVVNHVQDEPERAMAQFEEALAAIDSIGEPNPVLRADAMDGLSRASYALERKEDAETYAAKALVLRIEQFGETDPKVAGSYNQLAACQAQRNRYVEAVANYRKAMAIRGTLLERDVELQRARREGTTLTREQTQRILDVAASHNNVGSCLVKLERYGEAIEQYTASYDLLKELYGDEPDYKLAIMLSNRARLSLKLKNYAEAERDLRLALPIKIGTYDEDHHRVAITRHALAEVLLDSGGDLAEAESEARRALKSRVEQLDPGTGRIGLSGALLGRILLARGDPDGARPYLEEALPIISANADVDPDMRRATVRALDALASIADAQGDATAAAAYREQARRLTEG